MRLGLIIYGSLSSLSGGYLYDRKLVEHLQSQGDQVEIISLPWRGYLRHLGDNLSASLLRRLSRLEIDILLQDELNHPSLFWLNRRLRRRVVYPFISIIHHLRLSEQRPRWQNRLYRGIERRYLGSVDGFIYNSQTTRGVVEGQVGAGYPGLVAYPAGDHFQPRLTQGEITRRAAQPGPLRLLFLGNVIPRKGLHTLLGALSRIPRDAWALEVIGSLGADRAYAARMRGLAARLGLSGGVKFPGSLAEDELAKRLEKAHLLVVPSSYEGFGIAYLEGMGFGLPAIGTSAGSAGEMITHGMDGYLIEPGDAQALAGHLIDLWQDRSKLAQMSLAARRRYSAHPTWEQSGAQIRTFLSQMGGQ